MSTADCAGYCRNHGPNGELCARCQAIFDHALHVIYERRCRCADARSAQQ